MGPYATGAILSAMGVAQRYNKVLVHHTLRHSVARQVRHAVSRRGRSARPGTTVPNSVFDALAAGPKPPKTIAVVTSKFPSVHFMSLGAREVAEEARPDGSAVPRMGFRQPRLRPDRRRIKDAKPDFVWVGAIGLDGNQLLDAMKKIDYAPPQHFYLYPAPGPLVPSPDGEERAVADDLRGPAAVHRRIRAPPSSSSSTTSARPRPASPTRRSRRRRRRRTPPGRSSRPASTATKSLDDKAIAAWLKKNRVDTIQGKLRFDGPSNYGDDLMRVKQVQNGHWVVVWPKEVTAGGAEAAGALTARRRCRVHAAERVAARAVRPLRRLRRRAVRPARPRPQPELGPAAR